MENTNAVLIKPRMLFFKHFGGFLKQEEALKKAIELEKELRDYLLHNDVEIALDIERKLQFRQKKP